MAKSILFDCPKAGAHVRLEVENEVGGFFKKIINQTIIECDLRSMGGCRMKIEPLDESPCVALAKAKKCALK